jgi:hypothetical protein
LARRLYVLPLVQQIAHGTPFAMNCRSGTSNCLEVDRDSVGRPTQNHGERNDHVAAVLGFPSFSARSRTEEIATDFLKVVIAATSFGNRQPKIQLIARRHETAVENVKKQSSTAMSTEQVKSGNLFHAMNETAQEN